MDGVLARAWVREIARLVDLEAGELTRLDAAIGDGDHGLNLRRGFTAAVTAADALPGEAGAGEVLKAVGKALIDTTGGASGPLYGTFFRRAGKALGEGAGAGPVTELAAALAAGLAGVKRLGGAEVGDKTMVDALEAGVGALAEMSGARERESGPPVTTVGGGSDMSASVTPPDYGRHRGSEEPEHPSRRATHLAAGAAARGRDSTVPMRARKGRASYLGDRSIGHLDPGAASAALLFRALATVTPDVDGGGAPPGATAPDDEAATP